MYWYLGHLRQTFELQALTWNFSATSHGKGAIDGVGGTLKRFVYRHVLAKGDDVRNASEFFQVAQETAITCFFLNSTIMEEDYENLRESIEAVKPVKGIKADHFWCASSTVQTTFRHPLTLHSLPETSRLSPVSRAQSESDVFDVGSLVIVAYDGQNYPGRVTKRFKELDELEVSCMEKISGGWKWPDKPDICIYPVTSIKTLLSPALLQPMESLRGVVIKHDLL